MTTFIGIWLTVGVVVNYLVGELVENWIEHYFDSPVSLGGRMILTVSLVVFGPLVLITWGIIWATWSDPTQTKTVVPAPTRRTAREKYFERPPDHPPSA